MTEVPNWFLWVYIGVSVVSTFATIFLIDEPRKPITKTTAAIQVAGAAAIIGLMIYWMYG